MTRNTKPTPDKSGLQECDCERVFSSPVARAFVSTVVERRGVTEAQARQIYLDYINRTQPGREHRPCPAA